MKLASINPQAWPARYVVVAGLALVLAAAAVCRLPGRAGPEEIVKPAAGVLGLPPGQSQAEAAPNLPDSELPPAAAPPFLSKDLFEPPAPLPELTLTATILSPRGRVAMINDRPVAEGERILGARVVRIEEGSVLIRAGGRSLKLNVCPVREK